MVEEKKSVRKAHKKLLKLAKEAELCLDRKHARKLIKKAEKAHSKITS